MLDNNPNTPVNDGKQYYSPKNIATIAGILTPSDGYIYKYAYDNKGKRVILEKVSGQAIIPHKGASPHPKSVNKLLETYQKTAVVPIANNFLDTYQKHAVVPVAGANSVISPKTGKNVTLHTLNKEATQGKNPAKPGSMSPSGALGQMGDALKKMLFGGSSWPMARYYFYVMIGGTELGFQSCEGLEAEVGVIDYRDGNSPFFGKERMPGLITYSRVTLKKGVFSGDTNANKWFKEIAQDRQYTKRRTIIIALVDHKSIPQFVWRYEGAFLTKLTPTNLDAESENEVAIEELEFVGRAWYLETLAGMAMGAAGKLAGSIKF